MEAITHAVASPVRTQPQVALRLLKTCLVWVSAAALALLLSGGLFSLLPNLSLAHTRGASMEPSLKSRDVVLLRRVKPASVKPGDVIVFYDGSVPVIHRVIKIRNDPQDGLRILTQGDNNPHPDREIGPADVQAALIAKVPLLGSFARATGVDGGFFVYQYIALAVCLGLILCYAWPSLARVLARKRAFEPERLS
jgi:signal peptidase I